MKPPLLFFAVVFWRGCLLLSASPCRKFEYVVGQKNKSTFGKILSQNGGGFQIGVALWAYSNEQYAQPVHLNLDSTKTVIQNHNFYRSHWRSQSHQIAENHLLKRPIEISGAAQIVSRLHPKGRAPLAQCAVPGSAWCAFRPGRQRKAQKGRQ